MKNNHYIKNFILFSNVVQKWLIVAAIVLLLLLILAQSLLQFEYLRNRLVETEKMEGVKLLE
ncbi:hypothetical protein [Longirhabdus pacifica]|uniref:hypothetical protein n=1 Tax=Longirhabdus pacifica TaxID=2305227 RepID=UPI001009053C|nr:hypothetical protein [Longirhabdus pacifica]